LKFIVNMDSRFLFGALLPLLVYGLLTTSALLSIRRRSRELKAGNLSWEQKALKRFYLACSVIVLIAAAGLFLFTVFSFVTRTW